MGSSGTVGSSGGSGGETGVGIVGSGGTAGIGIVGGSGGTASGGIVGGSGGTASGGYGGAGATAGASGSGSGGATAPGSCDDFSCPDFGSCSLIHEANGCLRRCASNDTHILLNSNAQVAQLAALRCDVLSVDVNIYPGVDSLAGLETVREVIGELNILQSYPLTSLAGLDGLEKVDGSLVFSDSANAGARTLKSVVLPSLKNLGSLSVLNATTTESIHAIHLPSLETAGLIWIELAPDLTVIDLPVLKTVTSYVRLRKNDSLTGLSGFAALQSAHDLYVTMNPKLPQCQVDALAARLGISCTSCDQNDPTGICM